MNIPKYQTSNLSPEEAKRIYRDLFNKIVTEKIYLDPLLSLKSLADDLGTNTKYLSQVVNSELDQNFQALINTYRIQEFKRRLLNGDAKRYTYFGLARECGFLTRSTFYRAFQTHAGLTPKQFYKATIAA